MESSRRVPGAAVLILRLVAGLAVLSTPSSGWMLQPPPQNRRTLPPPGGGGRAPPTRTLVPATASPPPSLATRTCSRSPLRQRLRRGAARDDDDYYDATTAAATAALSEAAGESQQSRPPRRGESRQEDGTSPRNDDSDDPQPTPQHETSPGPLEDLPFGDDVWSIYKDYVVEIMKKPRVVKKEKPDVAERCREYLLSRRGMPPVAIPRRPTAATTTTTTSVDVRDARHSARESFRTTLHNQERRFQDYYNMTAKERDLVTRCLVYMGDACAAKNSTHPLSVAWHKMKEMGITPREGCISTYMYSLSRTNQNRNFDVASCDDRQVKIRAVDDVVDDDDDNALLELVTCHDLLYEPNEKTTTIRLKTLIVSGDVDAAEGVLAALEEDVKRLRTFMPLMEYYCHAGDGTSILRLFWQMQNSPGVHWDADSYTLVLASLARFGYFCGDAASSAQHRPIPTPGGSDATFSTTRGPELFDALATEMAQDILELPESATVKLTRAFQEGFVRHNHGQRGDEFPVPPSSETLQGPTSGSSGSDGFSIQKVQIPSTGICPLTGARLRLLSLDDSQRQHVHDTLLEMARLQSQQFVSSNKNKAKDVAETEAGANIGYEALWRFSEWLDSREGDPFTAIVDGANVAYFGHSRIHYSSVKSVVERLESMGERPLVVMPHKYIQPQFHTSNVKMQKLSEKDLEVIEWLDGKGMVFAVPRLCLDDYYWMLASVSNQTNARQHEDLSVPIGDDQGRFPGMRPMLVTNDKMRDHKLDLLNPREFRRWCSCHIVNYHVSAYEDDEWIEARDVTFSPADFFSREIQGNFLESGKGKAWHFPVTNWEESEWLCLYIDR